MSIFGQEDGCLYVNSAHSMAVDKVEEKFPENQIPEANAHGAVPLAHVRSELKLGDQIGDLIIGRVAIRRYVQDRLCIITGRGYSRVQCNRIVGKMEFQKNWRGLPWMLTSSADDHLANHVKQAQTEHRNALEKARAAKHSTS